MIAVLSILYNCSQDPGCNVTDLGFVDLRATVSGLPIITSVLRNYTLNYTACDGAIPQHCSWISRFVSVVQRVVPNITLNGPSLVRLSE